VVAAHGINSNDGSCPVRHADLLAELKKLLGLHHENFTLAVITALPANPVGQTRRAAVGTLVRVRLGKMPVGPTLALAGLGRFFLGNSHFSSSRNRAD